MIAFSTTDRDSFEAVEKWKSKVEAEVGSIAMVLVQNKVDLIDKAVSSKDEVRYQFALPNILVLPSAPSGFPRHSRTPLAPLVLRLHPHRNEAGCIVCSVHRASESEPSVHTGSMAKALPMPHVRLSFGSWYPRTSSFYAQKHDTQVRAGSRRPHP